jgi:hypothetical protein
VVDVWAKFFPPLEDERVLLELHPRGNLSRRARTALDRIFDSRKAAEEPEPAVFLDVVDDLSDIRQLRKATPVQRLLRISLLLALRDEAPQVAFETPGTGGLVTRYQRDAAWRDGPHAPRRSVGEVARELRQMAGFPSSDRPRRSWWDWMSGKKARTPRPREETGWLSYRVKLSTFPVSFSIAPAGDRVVLTPGTFPALKEAAAAALEEFGEFDFGT